LAIKGKGRDYLFKEGGEGLRGRKVKKKSIVSDGFRKAVVNICILGNERINIKNTGGGDKSGSSIHIEKKLAKPEGSLSNRGGLSTKEPQIL